MLLQANIALLLSRASQQASTAAEIWTRCLLLNGLLHPLTMAIKSLFFEKQNIVSFVCQWQHMLPAFQNPQKCSKLPPFWMRKLCWQIKCSWTSLSCGKNLMSCMCAVLCFPVLLVYGDTSRSGTRKCSCTGGISMSGCFWMVDRQHYTNGWGGVRIDCFGVFSVKMCSKKKILYGVLWFLLLYRNRTQFQSLY